MSGIEKGNFSEHDLTSEEWQEKLKILDTFPWVDEQGIKHEGVIKYAEQKDRDGVKAVEMDKRKDRMEKGWRTNDLSKEPDMKEFDESLNEPDKLATFVLTIDGEVASHIFCGKDSNRENTVELYTVTTMKKYRGNGFMPRLLEATEKEVQNVFGAETVRLSTQEENEDAVPFYPKVGYVWEGERAKRPGEWKGKSPYWSIIFVKHLKESMNQREPMDLNDVAFLAKLTEKIQTELPKLEFTQTRLIKEGLDNAVVIFDEKIVFRFPWTERDLQSFTREAELLEKLHDELPLPIPRYEYMSAKKDFGGYEMIQGNDLTPEVFETLPENVKEHIANQLGEFLSALHTLPTELAKGKHWRDPKFFSKRYSEKRRATISSAIQPELLGKIDSFYEAFAKLEAPADAFIHADMHERHFLLSKDNDGISGVIDFGEAALGDRAYDFLAFNKYGDDFLKQVLKNYNLEHDGAFISRSKWYLMRTLIDDLFRKIEKGGDITELIKAIEENLTKLQK